MKVVRIQLVIPDEDRDRFVRQARSEGMTLSEWLKVAAHRRLEEQQRSHPFESPADLEDFFRACDELEGPEWEPDWQEHLAVIDESRKRLSNS